MCRLRWPQAHPVPLSRGRLRTPAGGSGPYRRNGLNRSKMFQMLFESIWPFGRTLCRLISFVFSVRLSSSPLCALAFSAAFRNRNSIPEQELEHFNDRYDSVHGGPERRVASGDVNYRMLQVPSVGVLEYVVTISFEKSFHIQNNLPSHAITCIRGPMRVPRVRGRMGG